MNSAVTDEFKSGVFVRLSFIFVDFLNLPKFLMSYHLIGQGPCACECVYVSSFERVIIIFVHFVSIVDGHTQMFILESFSLYIQWTSCPNCFVNHCLISFHMVLFMPRM